MQGMISINSVTISNILSFGSAIGTFSLEPLNVIVGPNGSGKSNLLEVLRLLQASPEDFTQPLIGGGGIEHWLYKGILGRAFCGIRARTPAGSKFDLRDDERLFIEHELVFRIIQNRFTIGHENIFPVRLIGVENPEVLGTEFYSYRNGGRAAIAQFEASDKVALFRGKQRLIDVKELKDNQSILSQRNDPEIYPALYQLSTLYKGIHIFSETVFGRSSPARLPQDAALDSTFLFPDASNLALVLNDLQNQPPVMKTIIEKLKLFYERAENIITRVQGGTVQIYFQEEGLTATVPASRLSDGTLRYLCLLVILCHPTPPPLICIEEPELGMHPDVLPTIAELLIEASQRTQLIVTTHSDLLVSAIGAQHPEAIVVCEKGDNGTTMKRLEADKMKEWLTRYSLGDLWLKGEIGGTRW